MKSLLVSVVVAVAMTCTPPILAADQEDHGDQHPAGEVGPAVKLHGVVNSVNATAGRVNITHDPVPELKWPAMKMNFKAHDAAMLKDLKPGMTVDFEIQKMGNEYHITHIAPVQ